MKRPGLDARLLGRAAAGEVVPRAQPPPPRASAALPLPPLHGPFERPFPNPTRSHKRRWQRSGAPSGAARRRARRRGRGRRRRCHRSIRLRIEAGQTGRGAATSASRTRIGGVAAWDSHGHLPCLPGMATVISVSAVSPTATTVARPLVCVPVTTRAPREMATELASTAAALDADVAELRLDHLCRVRGAQGPACHPRQAAPAPRPRHLQVRPAPPGPAFWDCDDAIQLDWRIVGFQRLSAWFSTNDLGKNDILFYLDVVSRRAIR
jgi:hypothetical protein